MLEIVLAPPAISDRLAVAVPMPFATRASATPKTTLNPSVTLTEKAAHPAKWIRSDPVSLVSGSTATTPMMPWAADMALAGGFSSRRDVSATIAAPSMPAISQPAGNATEVNTNPSATMTAAAAAHRGQSSASASWRRICLESNEIGIEIPVLVGFLLGL